MAEHLNLQSTARLLYGQFFALSAGAFVYPAETAKFLGTNTGTWGHINAWAGIVCLTAGCALAAVAQMADEMEQRKALQYVSTAFSGILGAAALYHPIAEANHLFAGWAAVNLVLLVVSLYKLNPKEWGTSPGDDSNFTSFLRARYIVLTAIVAKNVYDMHTSTKNPFAASWGGLAPFVMVSLNLLWLVPTFVVMAVAQTDVQSRQKVTQYDFIGQFATLGYVIPAVSSAVFAAGDADVFGLGGLRLQQLLTAVFFALIVWGVQSCYPSAQRQMIVRAAYLFYGYITSLCLFFPEVASAVFQVTSEYTRPHVALTYGLQFVLFSAASRCSARTQGHVLLYSSFAHAVRCVCTYHSGCVNFGHIGDVGTVLCAAGLFDLQREGELPEVDFAGHAKKLFNFATLGLLNGEGESSGRKKSKKNN